MTPSIATKVLHLFRQQNALHHNEEHNLTAREKEVLKLLVNGDSYKMIADKLKVAYSTVNSHITNIYKKLHVNSIGEAVSKTLRNKGLPLF